MHQSTTSDKTQRLEWSNWAKGDTFSFGLEDVASVDQDAYQAVNMQVYNDGTLGVRPWFRRQPGTTTATSMAFADPSSGRIRVTQDSTNRSLYRDLGATSWSTDAQDPTQHGPVTPLGLSRYYMGGRIVTPNTSGPIMPIPPGGVTWYTAGEVDLGAPYSTAPNLFEPTEGELYKNRLYVVTDARPGMTDEPNRIRFTDLGDLSSLPAVNFVDLAPNQYDSTHVKHMWSTSDSLMIARSDGLWYALTGDDFETGSLREISYGRLPASKEASIVVGNEVWFLGRNGKGITIWSPNGESLKLDYIRPRSLQDSTDIVPFSAESDLLGGNVLFAVGMPYLHLIERVNEVWNYQVPFSTTDESATSVLVDGGGYEINNTLMVPQEGVLGMTIWNTSSPTGEMWLWTRDMTLDRPSADFDTYSAKNENVSDFLGVPSPGHASAGRVRLRKVASPDGGRLRIRRVYVDCRYWKNADNDYETPDMDARVETPSGMQVATTTWSGSSLADADNLDGGSTRITFLLPAMNHEDWAQVELYGIQSMSIKRVTVEFEIIDAIDGAL